MRDLLDVLRSYGSLGAAVYAAVYQHGRLPYAAPELGQRIHEQPHLVEAAIGELVTGELLQVDVGGDSQRWLVPGKVQP